LDAKLLILYNSKESGFDSDNGSKITSLQKGNGSLKYGERQVPIYGFISSFDRGSNIITRLETIAGEVIGIEISKDSRRVIRVGFDLFQEVNFLLTSGQPVRFSQIPSLDVHISILRDWILEFDLPLVEIPPIPAGYNFSCCLTHDIDFAGIRQHKFDHTMFGFLYRALFGSLRDVIKGRSAWDKFYENWKAVLSLPAVYAGFTEDFWMPFKHYSELEEGFRSTFFIIPFKNHAGIADANMKQARRATRYDVSDVKEEIQGLLSQGCEIGVHGIDAWRDTEKARNEFERIHESTGLPEIGIRMHWLYFNDLSPKILEDSGFFYDSTMGYNDAVGYRGGTTQVYRPIGLKKLLELPLNVQDTALFFPDRMALSEEEAWSLVNTFIENAERYGGVLTLNWHDRSLAPERLWGNFYIKILENLKKSKVWIDTASKVIRWFDKRRSCSFTEVHLTHGKINLNIACKDDDEIPDLLVRIHTPKTGEVTDIDLKSIKARHLDIHNVDVLNAEFHLPRH
jgi:hypothetical protein